MSAGLSSALKTLFNSFADSQPAMLFRDRPRGQDNPHLGNILDSLAKTEKVAEGTFDFAAAGGAVGAYSLGTSLPAGAIVTQVYTDATTALTSGGAATVALSTGADTLKAATAYSDASYTGLDQQLAAPIKTAAGGALTFTVAGAALTAGKMRVIVKYLEA